MEKGERALTERTLKSAELRKPGWYSDRDNPGFLFHRRVNGSAQFAVRYHVRGTKIRRFKSLGAWGIVTLSRAREEARKILEAAHLGGDPVGERKAAPTWSEWTERYFARITAKSKKTFHAYYLGLSPEESKFGKPTDPTFRIIRERWGTRRVDTFTPEDLEGERLILRKKGESTANRWLACIAGAFSAALRAGVIKRNPASAVRSVREAQPRSRVLRPEETKRLLSALSVEEDRHAVVAVLLALLAGARRAEALGVRWENVDLEAGIAVLPDSKSGKRRFLPLVPYLVSVLRNLPHSGPFVVASMKEKTPRPDIKNAWARITAAAGFPDLTFHDLRRSYGLALNRIAGLRVAQEGLGHSSPQITASTYTPEGIGAIKAAAEKAAEDLGLVN